MKFSIIIPIFNVEEYIEECIQSVINQDFLDYELILIDDGSTDGSASICDQYSLINENIKVIHQSNSGVSAARNRGIQVAEGDYLLFLDGDDFLLDNVLNKINRILNDKDYDIILASMSFYHMESKTFNNPIKDDKFYIGDNITDEIIRRYQIGHMVTNSVTNVYKRSFLIGNKISFNTGFISGEDLDFCSQFFLNKASYLSCNIPLCAYRINREGSVTTNLTAKALSSQFSVYIKWFHYFYDSKLITNDKYNLCCFYAEMFVTKISGILNVEKDCRKDLVKIAAKNFLIIEYPKKIKNKLIFYCYKLFGIRIGLRILHVYHILISNSGDKQAAKLLKYNS